MNPVTSQLLAATGYLLILVLVLNVHFFGLYEYSLYGINLSIYSLGAYLVYAVAATQVEDALVRQHALASIGTFFVYFILSSLYSGMMHALGYQLGVIDFAALARANFSTWVAIAPLLVILLHTLLSVGRGLWLVSQRRYPERAVDEGQA